MSVACDISAAEFSSADFIQRMASCDEGETITLTMRDPLGNLCNKILVVKTVSYGQQMQFDL